MQPLFAHHDMLDSLDFLGLNPVTPLGHVMVLAVYAMLAMVAFLGLRWAARGVSRRVRTGRTTSATSPIITPRTLEG
jgi:HAMP domain-containing protein